MTPGAASASATSWDSVGGGLRSQLASRLAMAAVERRAASAAAAPASAAKPVLCPGRGSASPSCMMSRSHCCSTEPWRHEFVDAEPGPRRGATSPSWMRSRPLAVSVALVPCVRDEWKPGAALVCGP
eukprot:14270849-Alexandrium_andersonii.AAC.1